MRPLNLSFRLFILIVIVTVCRAQERPFIFTLVPAMPGNLNTIMHYDAAYGNQTFEPLGSDNVEQNIGLQASLSESFMIVARVGLAMDDNSTRSAEHVELLGHILKSENNNVDFSLGSGIRHEYSGTNVLLGRAIIGRRFNDWQLYSNILLEKPLSAGRDEIDLILTMGWSYNLTGALDLGLEAVGEDLEGFWEAEEAEGGARLFVGPVVSWAIPATPWKFVIGAGPIIRATQSNRSSVALRNLSSGPENGYMVRAAINYVL
jgi:hypothetical protein